MLLEGNVLGLRLDVENDMFSATCRGTNGRICNGCSLKGSFRVVRDTRGCHPLLQGIVTTSYKGDGNVLTLVIVMVAQLWEQTKNHWTVRFKWVDYAGYVLYLNKAIVLKKKKQF